MVPMKRSFVVCGLLLLMANAVHAEEAKPKSNLFARANVLSKNALSITIRHSQWGEKSAYQFASDHCATFGKLAVRTSSSIGIGSDSTTTWICQEPPKADATSPAPPQPAPH